MLVVPKERAATEKLNVSYIDIKRLIEHQQGETGSGALHLESETAEGMLFYDQDDVLDGFFKDRDSVYFGEKAVSRIYEAVGEYNFSIDIYNLPSDQIYFWATMPYANVLHKKLSSEFTDLVGLVRKLESENLTGFIDVSVDNGRDSAFLFLNSGAFFGGSYSWAESPGENQQSRQEELFQKIEEHGAVFNVYRISSVAPADETQTPPSALPQGESDITSGDAEVIVMLEEFLGIFEGVVASKKGLKTDFKTLLNTKFVERADQYSFLDPFAAEFRYQDRKITLSWDIPDAELVVGVVETVKELARELKLLPRFLKYLNAWSLKFSRKLEHFQIRL